MERRVAATSVCQALGLYLSLKEVPLVCDSISKETAVAFSLVRVFFFLDMDVVEIENRL